MPTVVCPLCGFRVEMEEQDFDDEIVCPECGGKLRVSIKGGTVKKVAEVEIEEEEQELWGELEEEEEW